jgi:hypothetical protein
MAYMLGYFAADGSMITNTRGAHFIEFTSIDRILLENVSQATNSNHRIAERDRGGTTQLSYRLQIGSKEWFQDLENLCFTQNKSLTMDFPKIPKEYIGDFTRGHFDGDGCAYFKKHFVKDRNEHRWIFYSLFTSGSLKFLEFLWKVLKQEGIKGGHISKKSKGGYDLVFSWYDSLALYRLMYHTTEASVLFLPRKKEKMEQAIQVLELDK